MTLIAHQRATSAVSLTCRNCGETHEDAENIAQTAKFCISCVIDEFVKAFPVIRKNIGQMPTWGLLPEGHRNPIEVRVNNWCEGLRNHLLGATHLDGDMCSTCGVSPAVRTQGGIKCPCEQCWREGAKLAILTKAEMDELYLQETKGTDSQS